MLRHLRYLVQYLLTTPLLLHGTSLQHLTSSTSSQHLYSSTVPLHNTSHLVPLHNTSHLVPPHNTSHLVPPHNTSHLVPLHYTSHLVPLHNTSHLLLHNNPNEPHLSVVIRREIRKSVIKVTRTLDKADNSLVKCEGAGREQEGLWNVM
ncbi:hypothetical protein Pmani_016664 [Petrolisthes manimaculis]|uniref:Uncharacterized protein n=1 Tax=Petrolisthes manimaculis TaxID=1843537 RepID=A0AAE1PNG7_9EUCA|nr:hypothetical protein Pmani_016664 [Petrolisthes manimaculis]